jgi:hypothetical protein
MNNHDKIKQAFGSLKAPADTAEKVIKNMRGESPGKNRRPYHAGRVALAAVIIFSLTAVTALAAVLPGILRIGAPYWEEEFIGVETAGVYPISESLRGHIGNPDKWQVWTWGENNENSFIYSTDANAPALSSIEEAAEFYGVPFPKNPMLNEYSKTMYGTDGKKYETSVMSHITYYENEENNTETVAVYLFAQNKLETGEEISMAYKYVGGTDMSISASQNMSYSSAVDDIINILTFDEKQNNIQNYISPVNDIEAILYTVDMGGHNGHPFYSWNAAFAINGIYYKMTVRSHTGFEKEPYDTFKSVIDAYIF